MAVTTLTRTRCHSLQFVRIHPAWCRWSRDIALVILRLYGLTLAQTWYYFHSFPKDSFHTKILVSVPSHVYLSNLLTARLGCIPQVDHLICLTGELIAPLVLLAQPKSCSFPCQYTNTRSSGLAMPSCQVMSQRKLSLAPVIDGLTSPPNTGHSRCVYAPVRERRVLISKDYVSRHPWEFL